MKNETKAKNGSRTHNLLLKVIALPVELSGLAGGANNFAPPYSEKKYFHQRLYLDTFILHYML